MNQNQARSIERSQFACIITSAVDLSTEIKDARAKLGLSQSQAAKAWEVPVQTLQNWEHGRNKPRGFALKHLRSILDKILGAVSMPSESDFVLGAAAPEELKAEPESTSPPAPKRPRARKSPPKPKRRRASSRKPRA